MPNNSSSGFLSQFLLPIVTTVALVAGIICALLIWSTREVDDIAEVRQRAVVRAVVSQDIARIAHDQEASTVWDDAVRAVQAPRRDLEWLDNNLGTWLYEYYQHNRVYILDPANRPIYAMHDGIRGVPGDFAAIRAQAMPLIDELRMKMRHGSRDDIAPTMLTPGVSDLATITGHPAIVSVKPIISETGRLPQPPGAEYVHISVRYLDGSFLADLSRQYLFTGARFSRTPDRANEYIVELNRRDGSVMGYVIWQAFAPGSRVMSSLAPTLAGSLIAIALTVALLLFRIRRALSALKVSEAQAQHLAFHDTLTGLANRALFEDRLDNALAGIRRGGPAVALFYLDLDRFKAVNDTLGHPAGDMLIREVALRLKSATRETDTVARLGGDEFAIIQAGCPGAAAAEILCLRLVELISQPFDLDGVHVSVGVSLGVAMAPADGLDRIELSRKADIALYEAKANGRGRYVLFTEAMDVMVKRRQAVERDLRQALAAGDQLELYYQPVHDARSRAIVGAEALVRWHHPVQGMMSPVTFIPVAEECGLIEPLGEWVLREACLTARICGIPRISINVSAVQLRNPNFPDRVRTIITETGIDHHRVELEITETSFIENETVCQRNIATLRSEGVQIALDDFGTGYSSFNHLRDFEVDRLKVDRSFVVAIDPREGGSAIIRAIVDLATARGIAVTAEGVETPEQAEWLAAMGCGALQGFLLSQPMPRARIEALFAPTRLLVAAAGA